MAKTSTESARPVEVPPQGLLSRPAEDVTEPGPPRRPIRVMFLHAADWAGGMGIPVGKGTPWEIEITPTGILFVHRRDKDQDYFVPFAGIRFVRFQRTEEMG